MNKMMRFLFCITLFMQILTLFPVTCSRLLPPHHSPGIRVSDESVEASYSLMQEKEGSYRGRVEAGSRPPNCEHKCDGCNPCIAIQVPTITSHFGIQFANYEPESWKCKCGPTVFSP
ncbi:hypothetical protein RND81_05G247100 [Saponaria officinalis]|uniref:Epidermal patterning factor-like protein n=1 Tax=Saponaria officinalis TaxID=3572 RepID=A0AAW1KZJ7_SAPOF